ncbi:unnamed protein product [Chondrus crispus]|uniref:BAH domain-containing protein n=1 Tax=Chondrus crispus TaxID=2769 RepID=R7Q0W8_CHOCR|nr:unnamed protein product [Chondrus crispus]CDF32292.1 unnamed protein product [Chondrus crispus]|eukprot:XP_005711957.1 unnamed protein product [Chondrus crispus]
MVNRKRHLSEDPHLAPEIVTTEPVLVPPACYNTKLQLDLFQAVDYLGTRFRVGDHVAMYSDEGKEWVCVIEQLFEEPKSGKPKFKGRWFWSVQDIILHKDDMAEVMRPSKCESHEILCCDNRDTNLVESITRKCQVLSNENFQLVKKVVTKLGSRWSKVYFCERQYYHRAHRFSELNAMLFPGDPIPRELRAAAGLPEVAPTMLEYQENVAYENGYSEPELHPHAKRKGITVESEKDETVNADPFLIW